MREPVIVGRRVEDLSGLLYALKEASFAVVNVGADNRGTYVWLEDGEGKDPTALVESWMGKGPPAAGDMKAFEARKLATAALEEKAAAAKAAAMMQAAPAPPPAPRPSLISKVFKKLW